MSVTTAQRRTVIERAGGCCEYCRLTEVDEIAPFHIDHITPLKHGGTDHLDNLCLACYMCNLFKGSNVAAADPVTGAATFLYNPRIHIWEDHFEVNPDATLTGKTPEGRVTINVMRMNEEAQVQYRLLATTAENYPCKPG